MRKERWIGAAAVIALAGSLTVSPAMAFFTANTGASGVRGIRFGVDTKLEEEIVNSEKQVRVRNTGKSPCWVRAKIFYGESGTEGLAPSVTVEGINWSQGDDGWYYYTELLEAPEREEDEKVTELLKVSYEAPENAPDYDIIVVYEYMPFMGEEEGGGRAAWEKADWKQKADRGRTGAPGDAGTEADNSTAAQDAEESGREAE